MGKPVLSLSTFGVITNVAEKADLLLTHFVYSEKNQTTLYGNNVASLAFILQDNSNSINACCLAIRQTLQVYLGRYFDSVSVDVTYTDENPDKSSTQVRIKLSVTISDNGQEYQLSRLLRTIDGKFKEFVNLNNNGVSNE